VNPVTTPRPPAGLGAEVRDLRVTLSDPRGEQRVLFDNTTFSFGAATQVAICGPSGSGKTTLLHLLVGLQRPQRGTIRWSAVDVTTAGERVLDRWRRETVGAVFQQFHLFAGLSALENVLLPLRFGRWSVPVEMRRRAHELLERVAVRADCELDVMSRGEQQRVAVARALLRSPPIVIADEPTASLDRATGDAVAGILCALCRETGATLIVATHDPALAARLDHACDIVDGHLQPRPARRAALSLVAAR
jgi:putative ABC transport system ATP-binding protein